MNTEVIDVVANLARVQAEIAAAATAAHRSPDEVHLVAVSKTHGPERVRPVLTAGHRLFAENRVQEAEHKWPDLRLEYPDVKLHLIGPLQSNKAHKAVLLFDVIETVDSGKLARRLARIMADENRPLPVFLQVNTGAEPQKAGVAPKETEDFLSFCRDECGLQVVGLMCIPPLEEEPALHFALLRELAGGLGLTNLSMGMSADYEKAIAYGATHVRVGTAIFGAREAY